MLKPEHQRPCQNPKKAAEQRHICSPRWSEAEPGVGRSNLSKPASRAADFR